MNPETADLTLSGPKISAMYNLKAKNAEQSIKKLKSCTLYFAIQIVFFSKKTFNFFPLLKIVLLQLWSNKGEGRNF